MPRGGEDLEGAGVVVEVDGDVDVAVAGVQALGDALDAGGPAPGDEAAGGGEGLGVFLVRMPVLVRRVLVASTGCENLFLSAAGAVDSDALAGELPCEEVGAADVLNGGVVGEVDGLRYGGVRGLLEGGLHADVPLRGDVRRGDEGGLDPVRDVRALCQGVALGEELSEVVTVEAFVACDGLEGAVNVVEGLSLQDVVLAEGESEEGFDAAGAAGDHGDGAGGGDGKLARVAEWLFAVYVGAAALPSSEGAALLRKALGLGAGLLGDDAHDAASGFHALL